MATRSRNSLKPHESKHRQTRETAHDPLFVNPTTAPIVWAQNRAGLLLSFSLTIPPSREAHVNLLLENILGDPNFGLTATDRIILIHLAQHPSGARIEDIASGTGSKYRWVENQVSKLTRIGLLRRTGPNTYAVNSAREVQK
jgi:hypothetical protein